MKKLFFIVVVALSSVSWAQKKTATKAKVTTTKATTASTVLAKLDNLSAEIITEAGKKKLAIVINNAGKKENVILKEITTKIDDELPKNFTIKILSISGVKLYHFAYTEKKTTKTTTKTEVANMTNNEIWDFDATKVKIFSNLQTITNITEIVYLDKGKTASQTVEKTRKEGFEFSLSKDKMIFLSNKTQTDKYKFNATTRRFDPVK